MMANKISVFYQIHFVEHKYYDIDFTEHLKT